MRDALHERDVVDAHVGEHGIEVAGADSGSIDGIEQVLDDLLTGAGAMQGRGSGQRPHADFGAELLVALLEAHEGLAERADDAQAADQPIGR